MGINIITMSPSKSSRQTIRFFEQYIAYFHLLGVMPNYNFKKRKVVSNSWCSFKILLQLPLLVIGIVYLINDRFVTYRIYHNLIRFEPMKINAVLIVISDILGFCLTFNTMITVLLKPNLWTQLFNLMLDIERLAQTSIKEEKILKNGYIQNIIAHAIICFYISFAIIGSSFYDSNFDIYGYVTHFSYLYISLILLGIQVNLTICIKLKYRHLHRSLLASHDSSPLLVTEFISKTRHMYFMMHNVVTIFNEIYDTKNLMIFLYFAFSLLSIFFGYVTLFSPLVTHSLDYDIRILIQVTVSSFVALIMCGLLLATFCCDLAVKESKEIAHICHRLMRLYPLNSQETLEIENMAECIIRNKPVFTAAAFLEINRSTVFSIISGCGSYFIILVQFLKEL